MDAAITNPSDASIHAHLGLPPHAAWDRLERGEPVSRVAQITYSQATAAVSLSQRAPLGRPDSLVSSGREALAAGRLLLNKSHGARLVRDIISTGRQPPDNCTSSGISAAMGGPGCRSRGPTNARGIGHCRGLPRTYKVLPASYSNVGIPPLQCAFESPSRASRWACCAFSVVAR
jgi:hypothetical protein